MYDMAHVLISEGRAQRQLKTILDADERQNDRAIDSALGMNVCDHSEGPLTADVITIDNYEVLHQ
jgi:hypothetical protein